jgi:hypothetical protein
METDFSTIHPIHHGSKEIVQNNSQDRVQRGEEET